MTRTTIVVLALLLSGCAEPGYSRTPASSVWRHPLTGQEHLCTQFGRPGQIITRCTELQGGATWCQSRLLDYPSFDPGAYADCKSELEELGFVRVKK